MSVKLTILGSGSAVPTLTRGVTAQYLNFNERRILIDCGEGTQLLLRKHRIKFQRIQHLFISHLHGDHYLGLFGLLASMNLLGREKKLKIYGPKELENLLLSQFKLTKVYLAFELEFIHLEKLEKRLIFEDKLIEIYSFPLKHRVDCFGFLFSEKEKERGVNSEKIEEFKLSIPEILLLKKGEDLERNNTILRNIDLTNDPAKSVQYAFCTDTMSETKLSEWIPNVDLLYHEATFTNLHTDRAKATMHSTAEQAANIALQANAKKLILGHFSARYKDTVQLQEEAENIFKNTLCVEDGDEFTL